MAIQDLEKHADTVKDANKWLVSHAACTLVKEYTPKVGLEMVRALVDSNRDAGFDIWHFWLDVEFALEDLIESFEKEKQQ